MNAAKNLLKIGGTALLIALLVLVGTYFALPKIAPERVQKTSADSTASRDSTAAVAEARSPKAPTADMRKRNNRTQALDSTGRSTGPSERGSKPASAARSPGPGTKPSPVDTTGDRANGQNEVPGSRALVEALRDSVQTLTRRLQEAKTETMSAREEAKTLRKQLATAKDQSLKASELSSALLDMRRRELTALLKKVNMSVLEKLYKRASGRSRTRLLQSMAPKRAARFVNKVVEGEAAKSPSDAPPVSQ